MKQTQKKAQNTQKEHVAEKLNNKNSTLNRDRVAAFSAALSQGTVPGTVSNEILEGLSCLGNYSFVQAAERKEARSRAINSYAERETLGGKRVAGLKDKLSGSSEQKINEIKQMPEAEETIGIPPLLQEEGRQLSHLVPAGFDQGVFEQQDNSWAEQNTSILSGQEAGYDL